MLDVKTKDWSPINDKASEREKERERERERESIKLHFIFYRNIYYNIKARS
jgi:hypothetical protein